MLNNTIGTTLILIATNAYNKYRRATGGVLDGNTGLLKITPRRYSKLQSLSFHIQGVCILLWVISAGAIQIPLLFDQVAFELTANAQIWPRNLNSAIGGASGSIYLIVGDIGSNSGSGLDFVNGQAFLERFYSVYDSGHHRVGLATTRFTTATTN